ncbi:MAG: hypothetical protein E3J21_10835 [Anaerolineales bacterium]|nr:MAG: hypothetical protein E3J21_10835 [Anaerolineales bacterium]
MQIIQVTDELSIEVLGPDDIEGTARPDRRGQASGVHLQADGEGKGDQAFGGCLVRSGRGVGGVVEGD